MTARLNDSMQTALENPTAKIMHLYDAKIPHMHDRIRRNPNANVVGIRLDLATAARPVRAQRRGVAMMTTNSPSSKVLHDWSYAIVLVDAISGEPDPAEEHAPPGAITFRLRLDKPGLPELLLLTERHRPTRELHILCPGRIDRIALGTTVVTLRSLREDREMRAAFITLGQLLADATLVLGGANVGQGHDGQAFLQTLADLVQTEVSALVRVPPRPKAISPGAQSLFSSADHASSGGTSIQRRSCQLR